VEDGELDDASVEALEEDGDAARPACLASPRSSSTAHSATVGARTTNTFFWITGDKLQQEIKHRLEHIVGRATAFRYLRATAFRYLRQEKQLQAAVFLRPGLAESCGSRAAHPPDAEPGERARYPRQSLTGATSRAWSSCFPRSGTPSWTPAA
jgi:hypothetical protein